MSSELSGYKNIIYEKLPEDKLAIITFNRPEARNAMSQAMLLDFYDAIQKVADDPGVWCVIITGSGDKAFCSGGDAKEFLALASNPPEIEKFQRKNIDLWRFMEKMRKSIIAAVNGYCNMELLQAVDIVVSSDKAKFGLPEVKIGISPGAGITVRLPKFISKYWAKYLLLTGEWISPEDAFRIGFVNKIVPHEKLREEAINLARKIVNGGPLAVGAAKVCANLGSEMPIDEGMEYQLKENLSLFYSEDLKEGIKAFFYDKRQPVFKGK